MTETNVNRVITGVVVFAITWILVTNVNLTNNDRTQDANIKTGLGVDIAMKSELRVHGERLTGLEATDAGITALLGTVVKNQDRILAKLDARR